MASGARGVCVCVCEFGALALFSSFTVFVLPGYIILEEKKHKKADTHSQISLWSLSRSPCRYVRVFIHMCVFVWRKALAASLGLPVGT